jgi:type II secretory pathway pseudopilin PulG
VILASAGTVVDIVVGVIVVLLIVLFVGGYVVVGRRRAAQEAELRARIEAADAALAAARAQDKGWERGTIEAAARAAVAPRDIAALHLVQVVDRPGTDADQAVFRVVGADGAESTVTLGRRDGAWVAL